VGEHLLRWDVPRDRIVELDWGRSYEVGELTLTCTEARHFSGRWLGGNTTLWSSWVIAGERKRVYFGGDSGYTPAYVDIGAQYGPFDLTALPIGAYDARWRDVHTDPEEAVRAHRELRGDVLLPIHWATFDLAFHEWGAPAEWVVRECATHDVRLAMPPPGGRFTPDDPLPTDPWWQAAQ
jgi:L-ascorbate metabolism protein UlaG (beta-lactamase superfamily)